MKDKIIQKIDKEISDLEYSLCIGKYLKYQAGQGAFKDIEDRERKRIIELKELKKNLKRK